MTTDTEALVRRAYLLAEGDVPDVQGFIDLFAEDGRRVRREIHDHHQPTRRPGRLLPGRGPRPQPDRLRRDAARRPGVFGPPRDRAAAIEVLRTAVELGVNHIDTADGYGPYITNEIIREALFPYGTMCTS